MLEIQDLHVKFHNRDREAVAGISLTIRDGEILGLVGESGSGKTVTAMSIAGLLPKKQCDCSGQILLDGQDLLHAERSELRKLLGRKIGVVFQEPMSAMDPLMRVGEQVGEVLRIHTDLSRPERRRLALQAMEAVELPEVETVYEKYPHELSGGMLQRAMIAAAIVIEPSLLLLDEPTTALDVTIQARILELIMDIQKKMKLSVIYITHDLGVVAKVADYVDVMYAGKIVEVGNVNEIFYEPKHPYTWGLLSAMPDLDTDDDRLYSIPGSPPNLLHEPQGDAFAARNPFALAIDEKAEPPLFQVSRTHFAATWLLHPDAPKIEMPKELEARLERARKEVEKYL